MSENKDVIRAHKCPSKGARDAMTAVAGCRGGGARMWRQQPHTEAPNTAPSVRPAHFCTGYLRRMREPTRNCKSRTTKILKRGGNVSVGSGGDFLDTAPKTQTTKLKIEKLGSMERTELLYLREHHRSSEKTAHRVRENTCKSCTCSGVDTRTHKGLSQPSNKRANNPVKCRREA